MQSRKKKQKFSWWAEFQAVSFPRSRWDTWTYGKVQFGTYLVSMAGWPCTQAAPCVQRTTKQFASWLGCEKRRFWGQGSNTPRRAMAKPSSHRPASQRLHPLGSSAGWEPGVNMGLLGTVTAVLDGRFLSLPLWHLLQARRFPLCLVVKTLLVLLVFLSFTPTGSAFWWVNGRWENCFKLSLNKAWLSRLIRCWRLENPIWQSSLCANSYLSPLWNTETIISMDRVHLAIKYENILKTHLEYF